MKTKTRILTALLAIALSFTLFSVGSVGVFADMPDELDINGVPIADLIWSDPGFAYKSIDKLWSEDLPEERLNGTFIFLDSQLVDYNIVERLCETILGSFESMQVALQTLYNYNIRIFLHTSNWTFTDITMQAYGFSSADYIYDFTDQATYNWLYEMVGQVAMCGMVIMHMDFGLYSFLLHFQNVWQKRMPVYIIQRDPIIYDPDGLSGDIYTINGFLSDLGNDSIPFAPGG